MITLTLLHPVQSTPVQSWSFEQDPAIRIGRAVDNHVVLYSAVVSRYHVEIRLTANRWEVVNLGTNGTYLDGKRVHQAPLTSGSIMRLARSGPNIQIHINEQPSSFVGSAGQPNRVQAQLGEAIIGNQNATNGIESPALKSLPKEEATVTPEVKLPFYVGGRYPLFSQNNLEAAALPTHPCSHEGAPTGALICTDCGHPIHPLQSIGPYQVLKPLNAVESTLVAWRGGHTVVLTTVRPEACQDPDLVQQFENQARLLCQLEHPGMPKLFEAFGQDNQPYLVSEMIHGPNLRDWVGQHGSIPQYQVVQWALELSRLLDYLHSKVPSYIHCCIKPSNLIRPRIAHGSSQVVLVGFGELGKFNGPFSYTAPEQQAGEVSQQTDLYALGATLIYLLTGQEPDAFYRLGDNECRLHLESVSNISTDMATILQKLTYPDPKQRFESAAVLVEAFQALL